VKKPTIVALLLVTFSLGMMLAVFVGGSASAASPKAKKTTTAKKKTTTTTKAKAPPPLTTTDAMTTTTESPGDTFSVLNGTVNAASDHEIIGSSAFPNFTTGAVDNYYAMAHSHVDNSPFAQGTASPADTGPIGQTAAAGNTQQPQYADARWPGDSGKATYGNQGGPYATAEAGEYRATADASEATNGLSGPGVGGQSTLALPNGFPIRLREVLSAWKTKWQDRLNPKRAAPNPPAPVPTPAVPRPKLPSPPGTVTTPVGTVTTPVATVTTPTSNAVVGGASPAPPPVSVPPPPTLPSAGAQGRPSRSLAASSTSGDGESALSSSTSATLVEDTTKPKTDTTTTATTTTKTSKTKKPKKPAKAYAMVLSGESSLGRVTLGGGQIVIEGIHVTASITNSGKPTYKAAVSVASATIGGIPVTIDEDGVHVSGQGQGLPYQQASDALNGALKQAGIKLFLVGPEVKTCEQGGLGSGPPSTSSDQSGGTSSCDQAGPAACNETGPGAGMPPIAPPTSGDQAGSSSSCDQMPGMCDQSGTGNSAKNGTSTTSSDQSSTTSSCDQMGAACGQAGSDSGSGTGAGGLPGIGTSTTTSTSTSKTATTKSSNDQTDTTTTSSWCGQFGTAPMTGACPSTSKSTTMTTTASDPSETTDTTTTMGSSDQFGLGGGSTGGTEQTVTATGVHVVFTQPVSPPGVPAQYVEHILGEVYVDSLAVPALPLPDLGLDSSSLSSGSSSLSSSCLGGRSRGGMSGASIAGGGTSSAGGSGLAGSPSSAAGFGSTQGTAGSSPTSVPAAFARALRKPLWLLLAYLVWQALVIGTGWSLWNWRRDGPT
jgi:hypothetical protein